jgi:dTDP-4-dehydrorhamnose reductase
VTGGTGYLGAELVRRAPEAGWDVVSPSSLELDVRDGRAVARALADLAPDAVIHAAYRQDPPAAAWAVNVLGSAHVATALAGRRLVHVSTDVVFSGARGAYREDDELDPVTAYGESKVEAERAVRANNPEALIIRTSLIYGGPGYPESKHERLARDAAAGSADVTFFTDERRSPVQVGDLAAALLELVESDLDGILHAAGADDVSRCEFARLIAGDGVRCGPMGDVVRPRDCTLDSSRARAILRTRLRGCREVLA